MHRVNGVDEYRSSIMRLSGSFFALSVAAQRIGAMLFELAQEADEMRVDVQSPDSVNKENEDER